VATAHGSTLESLIKNPILSDLVGGIQAVTLGDDEAKRRDSQKTVLERENKPTFDICIEIRDINTLAIYPDVSEAVDHLLRGWTLFPEVRRVDSQTGETRVLASEMTALPDLMNEERQTQEIMESLGSDRPKASLRDADKAFKVFLYAINRAQVERIIQRLNLTQVGITNHIHDASAMLALKGSARPGSKILQLAKDYEVPVHVAKNNTMPQIQRALRESIQRSGDESGIEAMPLGADPEAGESESELALKEAADAVELSMQNGEAVELAPRRSYIRRLQHELVERHQLNSVSVGDEPNRRLKILPQKVNKNRPTP
jgi:hypothetical protein